MQQLCVTVGFVQQSQIFERKLTETIFPSKVFL